MRVVAALGGNALLQRGQPMTAENQRHNVERACAALAPIALEHELVISHGNGPQVGRLALQGAAYAKVETYPLDVLDAQTEGMIGYIIMQELGNLLPFEKPVVTLLTMIEVDGGDPAFENPTKPIGPIYNEEEARALAAEKGWAFKPDGVHMRRVVPSPRPKQKLERTARTAPISPCASTSRMRAVCGCRRYMKASSSTRLARFAASAISWAWAALVDIGFSTSTCLPAASAARASAWWLVCGVAM